jgi:hypothetical protein
MSIEVFILCHLRGANCLFDSITILSFLAVSTYSGARRQLTKAKSPPARSSPEHPIAAADRPIDRLVYDLDGLTEAEIRIVEAGTE